MRYKVQYEPVNAAICISLTQLAILRQLTGRNLMSFLTFLEERDVRPNSEWVQLTDLGRWFDKAEQSRDMDLMPLIENRLEYRQHVGRPQG